ncbi:hypothetical protein HGRIS_005357 [Hohenbuehelia grisea]|uniref:Uncharacterized protein n=1 Tax=Hohenbuehelia grisea TaxID=104357 RepID=A0ABR3JEU5_9AGAR
MFRLIFVRLCTWVNATREQSPCCFNFHHHHRLSKCPKRAPKRRFHAPELDVLASNAGMQGSFLDRSMGNSGFGVSPHRLSKKKCKGGRPCTQCVLLDRVDLCIDKPAPGRPPKNTYPAATETRTPSARCLSVMPMTTDMPTLPPCPDVDVPDVDGNDHTLAHGHHSETSTRVPPAFEIPEESLRIGLPTLPPPPKVCPVDHTSPTWTPTPGPPASNRPRTYTWKHHPLSSYSQVRGVDTTYAALTTGTPQDTDIEMSLPRERYEEASPAGTPDVPPLKPVIGAELVVDPGDGMAEPFGASPPHSQCRAEQLPVDLYVCQNDFRIFLKHIWRNSCGDAPWIANSAGSEVFQQTSNRTWRQILQLLVQADMHLGLYFLNTGRFFAAGKCTSNAVSFAVRQWNMVMQTDDSVKPSTFCATSLLEMLCFPTPDRLEATRVQPDLLNALLFACALNEMFSAIFSLSHDFYFTEVTKPWQYVNRIDMLLPDMEAFIRTTPIFEDDGDCLSQMMLIKSSLLLRGANELAKCLPLIHSGFVHTHEQTPFCSSIEAEKDCSVYQYRHSRLFALSTILIANLDDVMRSNTFSNPRPFVLARGICEATHLALFRGYAGHDKMAMNTCVVSANNIISGAQSIFPDGAKDVLDPVYGIIIVAACKVLIDARHLYPAPKMSIPPGMRTYLQIGMSLLEQLAGLTEVVMDQLKGLRQPQ